MLYQISTLLPPSYNSSLSCPSCLEADLITTLNVPALSAYYKVTVTLATT